MTIFKDNRSSSKKKKQVPKLRFSQEELPLIEDEATTSQQEEKTSQKKKTVRIPQLKELQSTTKINSDLLEDDIAKTKDEINTINEDESKINEIEKEVQQLRTTNNNQTVQNQIPPQQLDKNTLNKLKQDAKIKVQQELQQLKEKQKSEIESELTQYKENQMHSIDQERETLLNQAKETGLNEGREQGKKELKTQIEAIFKHINTAKKLQDKLLQDSEKNILELSVKIAEKIVQKEIKSQKKALIGIIKEAIQKVTDKDKVIIKTSPEELQIAQDQFSIIQNLTPDIKILEIEEDDRIQPGGCIIETKLGFVDSSISTKLDTIKKALHDAYDAKEE